jgi:hypothetical protein
LEEMPIASQNLTKEQAKIKTRLQEVLDNIK